MRRRDDVDKLYAYSRILHVYESVAIWTNAAAAILYAMLESNLTIATILLVIQIVASFIVISLNTLDDSFCWYDAEAARRTDNIATAFNMNMGELVTENYYNNDLEPSIEKYALNTFESAFFTYNIVTNMLRKQVIRTIVLIVVLFVSSLVISDRSILAVVMQTALTISIIRETIDMIRFRSLIKKLYDSLYRSLVTVGVATKHEMVCVLADSIEYEAVKAHFKVRLDVSLFENLNSVLSKQWDDIKKQIKV